MTLDPDARLKEQAFNGVATAIAKVFRQRDEARRERDAALKTSGEGALELARQIDALEVVRAASEDLLNVILSNVGWRTGEPNWRKVETLRRAIASSRGRGRR